MAVTWEEPKSARKFGQRGVWTEEVGELRTRPGQWGVIDTGTAADDRSKRRPYGLAGHIRSGGYKAFRPKGAFEAEVEYDGDGYKVFARYVGEGTPALETTEAVVARAVPAPAAANTPDSGSGTLASPEAMELLEAKLGGKAGSTPAPVDDDEGVIEGVVVDSGDDIEVVMPEWQVKVDISGLYALPADELRPHLESLPTLDLQRIAWTLEFSPFFSNRFELLGVIPMLIGKTGPTSPAVSPADSGEPEAARPERRKRTVQQRAEDPAPEPVQGAVAAPESAIEVGAVLHSRRGPVQVTKVTAKSFYVAGSYRVSRSELEKNGKVHHAYLGWVFTDEAALHAFYARPKTKPESTISDLEERLRKIIEDAGLDLRNFGFDPEPGPGRLDEQKVVDKIRACRAKATATDNPHEAEAFTEMANRLMAKYNISASSL